jgi:hypothetical protein
VPGCRRQRGIRCGRRRVALSGELDFAAVELFPLALRRVVPRVQGGELTLDATGVTFLDHRALPTLSGYARQRDITVVIRTGLPTVAKIVAMLNLTGLRVESPA